jgi:hypothetical protein
MAADEDFGKFESELADRINKKNDGSCYLWVDSQTDWNNLKIHFEELCPSIVSGWKKIREQQSKDEFEATESDSGSEKLSEL